MYPRTSDALYDSVQFAMTVVTCNKCKINNST